MADAEKHGRFCSLCGSDRFFRLLCQSGTELAHWSHYEVPDDLCGVPDEQLGCGDRRGYCTYPWWYGFRGLFELVQEPQEPRIIA